MHAAAQYDQHIANTRWLLSSLSLSLSVYVISRKYCAVSFSIQSQKSEQLCHLKIFCEPRVCAYCLFSSFCLPLSLCLLTRPNRIERMYSVFSNVRDKSAILLSSKRAMTSTQPNQWTERTKQRKKRRREGGRTYRVAWWCFMTSTLPLTSSDPLLSRLRHSTRLLQFVDVFPISLSLSLIEPHFLLQIFHSPFLTLSPSHSPSSCN